MSLARSKELFRIANAFYNIDNSAIKDACLRQRSQAFMELMGKSGRYYRSTELAGVALYPSGIIDLRNIISPVVNSQEIELSDSDFRNVINDILKHEHNRESLLNPKLGDAIYEKYMELSLQNNNLIASAHLNFVKECANQICMDLALPDNIKSMCQKLSLESVKDKSIIFHEIQNDEDTISLVMKETISDCTGNTFSFFYDCSCNYLKYEDYECKVKSDNLYSNRDFNPDLKINNYINDIVEYEAQRIKFTEIQPISSYNNVFFESSDVRNLLYENGYFISEDLYKKSGGRVSAEQLKILFNYKDCKMAIDKLFETLQNKYEMNRVSAANIFVSVIEHIDTLSDEKSEILTKFILENNIDMKQLILDYPPLNGERAVTLVNDLLSRLTMTSTYHRIESQKLSDALTVLINAEMPSDENVLNNQNDSVMSL